MITQVEKVGNDVVKNGVMTARAKMVVHFDTGSKVTIIPPDPYPSKEEQQVILDRLYSVITSSQGYMAGLQANAGRQIREGKLKKRTSGSELRQASA